MTELQSTANSTVKLFAQTAFSKKHREKLRLAALEGARLCSEALSEEKNGRISVEKVFATREALVKYDKYIDPKPFFDDDSGKYILINQAVAKKFSDTDSPQGIFALVRHWAMPLGENCAIQKNGKYAVLCGLQDPGNIGTIIRTSDALGIGGVILIGGCELYNPKLIRSAMGSAFRLPIFISSSLQDAIQILKKNGIKSCAAVVDKDADDIKITDMSGGCAVVIGNEGAGLSDSEAKLCSQRITIRMRGRAESLNAASAAAILLWEMSGK